MALCTNAICVAPFVKTSVFLVVYWGVVISFIGASAHGVVAVGSRAVLLDTEDFMIINLVITGIAMARERRNLLIDSSDLRGDILGLANLWSNSRLYISYSNARMLRSRTISVNGG
jgi:hypothetical protein